MTLREEQFRQDRDLRNAAKANFLADIDHLKMNYSGKAIADRTVGRVAGGAKDVLDISLEIAGANRGPLGALIGALILWFARNPILDALGLVEHAESEPKSGAKELQNCEAAAESVSEISTGEHHD
ncbi:MAG: hypothetical protein AAGK02_09070 [Pseudomonadota bacterium]